MLTRFKVNGFKNPANVDVAFGPFTCAAGLNGVGTSTLFDAIVFLSALADRSLTEAAKSVCDFAEPGPRMLWSDNPVFLRGRCLDGHSVPVVCRELAAGGRIFGRCR
jgi:hypothetical protein